MLLPPKMIWQTAMEWLMSPLCFCVGLCGCVCVCVCAFDVLFHCTPTHPQQPLSIAQIPCRWPTNLSLFSPINPYCVIVYGILAWNQLRCMKMLSLIMYLFAKLYCWFMIVRRTIPWSLPWHGSMDLAVCPTDSSMTLLQTSPRRSWMLYGGNNRTPWEEATITSQEITSWLKVWAVKEGECGRRAGWELIDWLIDWLDIELRMCYVYIPGLICEKDGDSVHALAVTY